MGKNIVVCCDGTGNEVQGDLSNVLKLFRIARKTANQRVYYHPGVGTIGSDDPWSRAKQSAKAIFGLATGYGLDDEISAAYRFICEHWIEGDKIFLFGFSRGAYTARAVAGFICMIGLLPPDQLNLLSYALTAYKRTSEKNDLAIAWQFGRVAGGRSTPIEFVGVWDTVASVIVPRRDRLFPTLQTLPYTRQNPSVRVFRHAISIDERRRMFRLNRWLSPQKFVVNRFDTNAEPVEQDIKQVWFSGVHSDVGGGYPEVESGLSKFPLAWMLAEAEAKGLQTNTALKRRLVFGDTLSDGTQQYAAPNAQGELHNSLTAGWKPLEWIPKAAKWREWPRTEYLGYYLPKGEPRLIANHDHRPTLHESVLQRATLQQHPENFPSDYSMEPWIPAAEVAPGLSAVESTEDGKTET